MYMLDRVINLSKEQEAEIQKNKSKIEKFLERDEKGRLYCGDESDKGMWGRASVKVLDTVFNR